MIKKQKSMRLGSSLTRQEIKRVNGGLKAPVAPKGCCLANYCSSGYAVDNNSGSCPTQGECCN